MSIENLIASAGERLTPTERRIAEAVLAEPTLLAFGTVAELADRVGTSRPSIVRFATKLGFDGFTPLQDQIRDTLSRQLSRPSLRIRQKGEAPIPVRGSLEAALQSVFDAVEGDRIVTLTAPIIQARNVWILSGETSMAGAHALHSGLAMVRPAVHLVEEHSTGRDLSSAAVGDAAVVFDFVRYRRNSVTAARALAELGVDIVAITDGPLSPLAALTSRWCELKIPAVGPFDSSVPSVALAELLVAQVAKELRGQARARIDRLESMWNATGTFLTYTPRPNRAP